MSLRSSLREKLLGVHSLGFCLSENVFISWGHFVLRIHVHISSNKISGITVVCPLECPIGTKEKKSITTSNSPSTTHLPGFWSTPVMLGLLNRLKPSFLISKELWVALENKEVTLNLIREWKSSCKGWTGWLKTCYGRSEQEVPKESWIPVRWGCRSSWLPFPHGTAYLAKPHLYLESKRSQSTFSSKTVSWFNLIPESSMKLIKANTETTVLKN